MAYNNVLKKEYSALVTEFEEEYMFTNSCPWLQLLNHCTKKGPSACAMRASFNPQLFPLFLFLFCLSHFYLFFFVNHIGVNHKMPLSVFPYHSSLNRYSPA